MKFVAIFLLFALILSVTGCVNEHGSQTVSMSSSSAPTSCTEEQDESYWITLTPLSEEVSAEDGTVLSYFSCQDVQIHLPQYKHVAESIEETLLAQIHSALQTAELLAQQARETYRGENTWSSYYVDHQYSPMRMDGEILSLFCTTKEFSGGAHASVRTSSLNINLKTGEKLEIPDILDGDEQITVLRDLVLSTLEGDSGISRLLDGYQEAVYDRFDRASPAFHNWYFDEIGLVYFFSPYEVAPYRDGVVTVRIPYSKLFDITRNRWLPEEGIGTATLQADSLGDVDLEFSQICRIDWEPEGEHILLHSFSSNTRIVIRYGYWGVHDNIFHPTGTLFHGACGEDQAIEIATNIPDTIPNIQIILGDGTVCYLFQSGEDGSVLLLTEDLV